MKNLNLKLAGTLALSLLTASTFAQDQWKLGGNTDFGPPPAQGLVSNSNYLGSLQNTPIVFGTNNTPRVMIANGTGTASGFVGISEDLTGFTPLDRVHLDQASGDVFTRYTPL